MSLTITFIGGGSFLWTARLATDLFLKPSLRGSTLILVDIDPEAAALVRNYCRLISDQIEAGWRIETSELTPALEKSDFVMVSISTGGLDAFERDYRIPEKYGVYHSVGDTVGPAGISRTLRNVPVFVQIAREMEQRCPNAWMIHVTNPLAQLTRCVDRATSIRTVGLCHNYEGTMRFLADYLEADRDDLYADTFGVNHFTWLSNATCRGESFQDRLTVEAYLQYEARRCQPLETGTTDDEINAMTGDDDPEDERLGFELCEQFGYFPVGGPPHIAENLPWYLNDPATVRQHRIRRKGVLPRRREGQLAKRQRIEAILAGRERLHDLKASHEAFADIVESLHTGKTCRAVVNLPNTGQISNLPQEVVVETWAEISQDRIVPLEAGPVPIVLKGMLESIIAEEELAVDAALTGDRQRVVQAMHISPLLHRKDVAEELTDELLAAQQSWLPQFNHTAGAVAMQKGS